MEFIFVTSLFYHIVLKLLVYLSISFSELCASHMLSGGDGKHILLILKSLVFSTVIDIWKVFKNTERCNQPMSNV